MLDNKQQQGILLTKPLVKTYTRAIGIEIGEAVFEINRLQKKLKLLRAAKNKGVKTTAHWKKSTSIMGIPIHYKARSLNKHIYYETSVEEPLEKFNKNMGILMIWLDENGYKPTICKRLGKFEMGAGVSCDIK